MEPDPPCLAAVARGVDLEVGEERRRFPLQQPEAGDRHPADLQLGTFAEEVVVHDEGDGAKGNLAFRAPQEGVYSYLWENKKGKRPVVLKVKLTLSGGARVKSVTPEK